MAILHSIQQYVAVLLWTAPLTTHDLTSMAQDHAMYDKFYAGCTITTPQGQHCGCSLQCGL